MFFLAFLEFELNERSGIAVADGSNSFGCLLFLGFNA